MLLRPSSTVAPRTPGRKRVQTRALQHLKKNIALLKPLSSTTYIYYTVCDYTRHLIILSDRFFAVID